MSVICPQCGKMLGDEARFCGDCGQVIAPAPAAEPDSSFHNVPYADDYRPSPESAVPDQYKPDTEPKNKFLGLGIGVTVAIAALILLVIVGVIIFLANMIPIWTGTDLSRQTGAVTTVIADCAAYL